MNLSEAERVSYLANVLSIAGVSGRVTDAEMVALRQAAERVGATARDAAAARQLLNTGHFEPALMRDQDIRIANLEDMLAVAFADGQIEDGESEPIEKLAAAMNYSQTDVDAAVRGAQLRLQKSGIRAGPPSLESTPKPESSASSVTRRPVAETTPQTTVTLHAPTPAAALGSDDPDTIGHQAPEGQPIDQDTAGGIDACMHARCCAADSDAYCFGIGTADLNPWGCRLLRMPWVPGQAWLAKGLFRDDHAFVFEREAIREELEYGLRGVSDCPYAQPELARCAWAALPSRARAGLRWSYRPAHGDREGIDMNVREYRHGCAVDVRRRVAALDPVGDAEWRRIVRDACHDRGLTPPWA